jgi:magnesium-transporting ATPase (P-type)
VLIKERRFKNKASYMLRMIDTSLDYYANCHIVDGIKTYPESLNDIREELVKHSFNFYSEFCIQKDFMLVYVPTKINNKIAQYTLAIINTNCQIFYSNRSTGGENEIIKFISKEDNNNLKRYDAISKYFINRRIFLFFYMLFIAIFFFMIYSNVLISNEIYLIACLLLVNLLLSFFYFVYKDLFCNEILANEVSLFISFNQIKTKASTK